MEPLRFPVKASDRTKLFDLIKRVSFRRGDFTLASGKKSDFYLDMKPTMFDAEGANLLAGLILQRIEGLKVDAVGGMALGAIPLVVAVSMASHQQNRPIQGFFVRKDVKEHGTKRRLEAITDLTGKNVLIIEDVTTTGGSAMQSVEEVQKAGGNVVLVLSVVDREEGAVEFYKDKGLQFDSLFQVREFKAS